MIEFRKGNVHKARSGSLCITQVGLFVLTPLCVSSVFAAVLFTQALDKTLFLLYHWELPNSVASDEIHPEILQN